MGRILFTPSLASHIATIMLLGGVAHAAPPGEVPGVQFTNDDTLSWSAVAGDFYNVYRGRVSELATGAPRCHGFAIATTDFTTPEVPTPGEAYGYLITAESTVEGEGSPGLRSDLDERPLLGGCTPVMRNHVLNRVGSGGDTWSRDRVETLGLTAYITEQLEPELISEPTEYLDGIAPYSPPTDILGLIGRRVIGHTYSRRQLEWEVAAFWNNHFNTFWAKVANIFLGVFPACEEPGVPMGCDPSFPAMAYQVATDLTVGDMNAYKDLTFGDGTFRDLLGAVSSSVAMIIYLDTYTSVAGAPNENYPRELLELYSMGVDGGYTQQDVEELSRVFTGWTACTKSVTNSSPLAPCIAYDSPDGVWVAHFISSNHDCDPKTLFAGTPHQVLIPNTCSSPTFGPNDVGLALDGIAAHPATARFISKKLLQWFITEDPDEALIDEILNVWNDAGNPQGVGDMKAVLSAVVLHPTLLDPDRVSSKIKTPVEQFTGAIRAIDGTTDGLTWVLDYLSTAQHLPHFNEVPTGYPELGQDWIGTGNLLERQNFAIALAFLNGTDFGSDPAGLLAANGVATTPGNAAAIVDFFAGTMFGGALTPAEKQAAIDYLETDSTGAPDPNYDDGRIRETVAFMLGYAQFLEQ